MNIGIIATNEKTIRQLKRAVINYSMKKLYDCDSTIFNDPKKFLNSREVFDILFVDDCTPKQTSIMIAKQIRALRPGLALVIISSRPETVYEAFPLKAFRFLTTPVSLTAVYETLDSYRREALATSYLIAKVEKKYCTIPLSEILYLYTENRETTICTTESSFVTPMSFPRLYDQLPHDCFFTCHRSTTVNMHFIAEFSPEKIILKNGDSLPLSKRRKMDFYIAYNNFLKTNSYI